MSFITREISQTCSTKKSHSFKRMNYITRHNSLNKLLVPFCLSSRVLQSSRFGRVCWCEEANKTKYFWDNFGKCFKIFFQCQTQQDYSNICWTFVATVPISVPIGKYNYHSLNTLEGRTKMEKQTYRFIVIYYFSPTNLVNSFAISLQNWLVTTVCWGWHHHRLS